MSALVVSDSSPLNILIRIDHARVLPALFERVIVPPEVLAELRHPKAPVIVRTFILSPPNLAGRAGPANHTFFGAAACGRASSH